MTNKEILNADMLDILFEHRNKLYGAYTLRRNYKYRLFKALGITFSVVMFFLLLMSFRKKENSKRDQVQQHLVEIKLIDPIKPIEPPPPPPPPPQVPPTPPEVDYQVFRIVRDDSADLFLPDVDAITNANISNRNTPGDPNAINRDIPNQIHSQSSTETQPAPPPPPPLPSRAPSFPGGTDAWLSYLKRFLQTPDELEPGQRIEVKVKFWVETDGSVSRFEILQSGGSAFDREVLRVLKKMPRWEPAIQNGQKQAVSFTQPVVFVGVEE